MKRVFVFGIDGAPPDLIFDKWRKSLPNINRLMEKGIYAKMNSAIPPSTIVAWNSMFSGKDTCEIGVFSYTYKDSQGKSRLVSSNNNRAKMVWEIIGNEKNNKNLDGKKNSKGKKSDEKSNKKSIVLYVPLSYPVSPINGCMISDFLTPSVESNCAYPERIHEKIKKVKNPEIFFDVAVGLSSHKGLEIPDLLNKTYEMTKMQLDIAKDMLLNETWELFICVIIGTDRLQHMLWRHFDETHRRFIPNSPYKNALRDYYLYLDKELGIMIESLDKDCSIIVASDHGMIKQEGKININNWLIREGYLVLKKEIDANERQKFSTDFVDMDKSLAYGGGAYNARVYINKELIKKKFQKKFQEKEYKKIRSELIKKLKEIPDDKGKKIDTKVFVSDDIYKDTSSKECPDLTIYFDDLRWASNPDLGQKGLYSWESAVGADSAGHSKQGCFIAYGSEFNRKFSGQFKNEDQFKKNYIGEIDIRQVAPTILQLLGVKIPKDIEIKSILGENVEQKNSGRKVK